MDTSELVRRLASETRRSATPVSTAWWWAACLAITVAAAIFFGMLGPRTDIATAAETHRFLFKFLVTITLAASAFGCVRALSRPGENWHKAVLFLGAAPALIVMAVVVELFALPSDMWATAMVGTNSLACLIDVSLIGLGPLAIFQRTLHYGAPTRPALAGGVAGLLAGGIAATFYAARCTDDSPLFVATWYTMAIAILAVIGAAGTSRFARW